MQLTFKMEEIMDYVDENDNVLGQDTRENIKNKKLNYRGCHIWVLDGEGRLLICKRPLNEKAYAGLWTSSAGGHVQAGETYQQAALREAKEELGLTLKLKHWFKLDYIHPRGCHVFIDIWIARNPKNLARIKFDPAEIIKSRFISFDELSKEMVEDASKFNPQLIQMVEKWNSRQKGK